MASLSQQLVRVGDVENRQKRTSGSSASSTASGRPSARAAGSSGPVGDEFTSVDFAQMARRLNQVASAAGLRTPAFRSPPRTPGLRRSIVRRPDGSATVSVALRGRPAAAVVADMIDGVMAANEQGSTRSADISDRLWSAAAPLLAREPEAELDRRAA